MSNTYNISGRGGVVQNLIRGLVLVAAAIGGFFMLAFSAAFAFFVISGLIILGLAVFAVLWTRAKLLGKPFGPRAQFETMKSEMDSQFESMHKTQKSDEVDGPIIDAHKTPEGWTVD